MRRLQGVEDAGVLTVHALLPVDVVDHRNFHLRIGVTVEACVPVTRDRLPIVARVELAGLLRMRSGAWPRHPGEEAAYALHDGATFREMDKRFPDRPRNRNDEPILRLDELRALGVAPEDGAPHGVSKRAVWTHGVERWHDDLSERYDLTHARSAVAKFRHAVATDLVVADGTLWRRAPLPVFCANAECGEIALEADRSAGWRRGLDVFPVDRLEDARRYLDAMRGEHRRPFREIGSVFFLDEACVQEDDLDAMCREVGPWAAAIWTEHVAHLPADLVPSFHDAANYAAGSIVDREERVRLLSSVAELLRRSDALPRPADERHPCRVPGDRSVFDIRAAIARIHHVERIQRHCREHDAATSSVDRARTRL